MSPAERIAQLQAIVDAGGPNTDAARVELASFRRIARTARENTDREPIWARELQP